MNNPNVPVDAIGRAASIHFVMMPEPDMFACCDDPVIRRQMRRLMMAIEMGRVQRERKTISLKMPVRKMVIASNDKDNDPKRKTANKEQAQYARNHKETINKWIKKLTKLGNRIGTTSNLAIYPVSRGSNGKYKSSSQVEIVEKKKQEYGNHAESNCG